MSWKSRCKQCLLEMHPHIILDVSSFLPMSRRQFVCGCGSWPAAVAHVLQYPWYSTSVNAACCLMLTAYWFLAMVFIGILHLRYRVTCCLTVGSWWSTLQQPAGSAWNASWLWSWRPRIACHSCDQLIASFLNPCRAARSK
jgi:hypothetical protein